MREICTSGSMRGRRKRTALYRACVLLYKDKGVESRPEELAIATSN